MITEDGASVAAGAAPAPPTGNPAPVEGPALVRARERLAEARRQIATWQANLGNAQAAIDAAAARDPTGATNADAVKSARDRLDTVQAQIVRWQKEENDAANDLAAVQAKEQVATTSANKPGEVKNFDITINGQPRRNVPHQWVPNAALRTGGEWQPIAGQLGEPSKARTAVQIEKGPDGAFYRVAHTYDEAGNDLGWNGEQPVKVAGMGEDPSAAVNLTTAQTNLEIAKARLADATGPTAQAKARADLAAAEAQLARIQAEAAQGRRPTVIQPGTGRFIVQRDPTTGALTTQPNPAYEARLPEDPYAAYAQVRGRVQTQGEQLIARLQAQQRAGLLSPEDAETQFGGWLAGQQEELSGLEALAQERQRQEQIAFDTAQRQEQQRVEGLNRERERYGYEAGQAARTQMEALLPQVRTPQFLQQYGANIASMQARAHAPSAEAAAALPQGPGFTADTFNPANFQAVMPNLDQIARERTAQALAAISPAAAATINRPAPRMPSPLDVAGLLGRVPYAGALTGTPTYAGAAPTPGMNPAQDLGPSGMPGFARTRYGPTGSTYLDWRIPG